MVFGFQRSVLASTIGKNLGAITAFWIGRTILQSYVAKKLADNETFSLLDQSVEDRPFLTAILIKYSCFPEFVKNYGTAILRPVTLPNFIMATLLHGGPWTVLWSYVGVDASRRIQQNAADESITDPLLKIGLIVGGFVG
eukprot:CAMPEP_0194162638 /NCGR_PEP_ID=MMETSP0152-20130528/79602_1 /TAXON_ID=1049557 /ORGANISM="Thalassiothrix antarctica, Strain L6-D1" /LENGTH=139 /DNA_ID=CAMNT_0038872547 /DNA_START=557 /DNA_END=973 /DNA_ORIENTATION=-